MATRMNQGAGDASVTTELLTGINFENVKNERHSKNGYSKMYPNGYTKYVDGTNCYKRGKSYLNGHTLTSSSDEEHHNLKDKYVNRTSDNTLRKDAKKERVFKESFEQPSILTALLTHLGFYILMFLGYLSQAFFPPKIAQEKNRDGYPPLYDRFASFYSRYVYRRVRDCWNYPICSVPGAEVILKERVTKDNGWTFEFTGNKRKCLNLGSYNYLGFAEPSGPCAEFAIEALHKYGVSTGATRQQYGTCELHVELEKLTAEFLGVEDAITFGMGFATNALNIPTLLSPGCLVISDEKNHASLILGIRLSGATVKVFHHNDVKHLEKLLRDQIYYGQPNQPKGEYKPWKKILIVVEGVYSMEGTIVRLPEIIALKKKYKAYLYLDEAHSIGAIGKNGRGVIDYFNCDPKDVDILMGTFTKSFGSAGGYIAGSKQLITYLRQQSYASKYACAMSPPVAAQIIAVLKILMGKDGTDTGRKRIETLARNTRYFRRRLAQIGVITYGNEDSPVVPILAYLYSKIAAMVRTLIELNIATVGVGYPATPLMEGRIRICLSAAHTKEQLDYALETISKVADEIGLKFSRLPKDPNPIEYDKIELDY
ncbi:hypothetical protein ILUMI_11867 [Ignelater luminosus]|uniref:serine C-palmitoyltransferase n=1 Tax=Ignelater luminosus TaxID=2038154 RepID=A0A8K0CVB0_IGNLU|nr:hypothetical protein ILUMI_11867 [Ignelater luminosus]